MHSKEHQFRRLTHLVLDGIATDSEREELRRLSVEHPELVSLVVDDLVVDGLLQWQGGAMSGAAPLAVGDTIEPKQPAPRPARALRSIGAVAATLLVGLGLALFLGWGSGPIAEIVQQNGVQWSDACAELVADGKVGVGRLESTGGEYVLQFRDGPTVRVNGPASLDIKSSMLVQLNHGTATASVPTESIGFTITSELVDVVDQGTEFGISVANDEANVVVFDGKVDVQTNLGSPESPRRLKQGQAVKVDREGPLGRLADVRRDAAGRWWSGDRPNADRNLIKRVFDNIATGDPSYSCYQTTSRGLDEDVLAYSDNPNHQWNGLDETGLPNFLRGADYIRTFNHYRYMEYFKLTIELSEPANLYVFTDNRIPPPEWLTDQFEDTGVDIGLDEGPWLEDLPPEYRKLDINTTADGAGVSIDNVFSVWRRQCLDIAPITLGTAGLLGGEGNQGRAMYGIAVTPLSESPITTAQASEAAE